MESASWENTFKAKITKCAKWFLARQKPKCIQPWMTFTFPFLKALIKVTFAY